MTEIFQSIAAFLITNKSVLTVVCIVGLLFCFYHLMKSTTATQKRAQTVRKKMYGRSRTYLRFKKLCSSIVEKVAAIPILGDIIKNMSWSYICEFATTEDTANYMAGRSLLLFLGTLAASFVLFMVYFKDIIMSIIAAIVIASIVLNTMKGKPVAFLTNIQQATEDFLHSYHINHGNLDLAFQTVIQSQNPVAGHFAKMYDYVKRADVSPNPESIQKEYYAIAPARILRNLYSVIYMTYKYGDEEVDGRSQFTMNICKLQQDIADAIYSQSKLADGVFGVRWFIALPMFALPYLGQYMLDYFSFEGFEFIELFIHSPWGYATMVVCAGITLICYFLYEKMTDSLVLEHKSVVSWENKLLRNPRVRKAVQFVAPKKEAKRIKLQTIMMRSGSTESIEALYIRRIATTILVFVICLVSVGANVLGNISTVTNNIYQGLAKDSYYQILLTQNDVDNYIAEQTRDDKLILSYIKTVDGFDQMEKEEQETVIYQYMRQNDLTYRGYKDYAVQRILSKHTMIAQAQGVSNFIFVILFTLVAWWTPLLIIFVQAFLNKEILISDEVSDLQTMTIMLISHKSCTPQQLLTWYADSSILFSNPFHMVLATGDFSSLHGFIDYTPFNQLVDCLEMSFSGMDLHEAFSDIEQKQAIQSRLRARTDEKNINFRISVVDFFSNISMGAVLGLYVFVPMLIAMVQMFFKFSGGM